VAHSYTDWAIRLSTSAFENALHIKTVEVETGQFSCADAKTRIMPTWPNQTYPNLNQPRTTRTSAQTRKQHEVERLLTYMDCVYDNKKSSSVWRDRYFVFKEFWV
jgi:hypothetical protein